MAHKNWCGSPCVVCSQPCELDASMPCPLDCENIMPDGNRAVEKCGRCNEFLYAGLWEIIIKKENRACVKTQIKASR